MDINNYMFHYLCMMFRVELCLDKIKELKDIRNVDDIRDRMSIYGGKVSMNDWHFNLSGQVLIVALISILGLLVAIELNFIGNTFKQNKTIIDFTIVDIEIDKIMNIVVEMITSMSGFNTVVYSYSDILFNYNCNISCIKLNNICTI